MPRVVGSHSGSNYYLAVLVVVNLGILRSKIREYLLPLQLPLWVGPLRFIEGYV